MMTLETLKQLAARLDPKTIQTFVHAVRVTVDAIAAESKTAAAAETPAIDDYAKAELPRDKPAGGWIGFDELREKSRQMVEAVAAEKLIDGFVMAVELMVAVGL